MPDHGASNSGSKNAAASAHAPVAHEPPEHGPVELGPVDWPAWTAGLVGMVAGLLMLGALYLAGRG